MSRNRLRLMVGAGALGAVVLGLGAAAIAQAPGELRTGAAAYGDWSTDAPGVRRKITANDLPTPTGSSAKSSKVIDLPAGYLPKAPAGFKVEVFATLDKPRAMRLAPNGDVFVAETGPGRVKVIRTAPGASKPTTVATFAEGLTGPFGIAFYPAVNPQWVYVSEQERIKRYPYRTGDLKARGPAETVVATLTTPGGHSTRDLVFTRDGKTLLAAVGSITNYGENTPVKTVAEAQAFEKQKGIVGAAYGADEERANVLAFNPDGSGRRIYASGIRNCVGLNRNPVTGDVYCAVNERDAIGDNTVPDYVTRIKDGGFYGWPYWYIGNHEEPRLKGQRPDLQGKAIVPDVLFRAHSAAVQVVFNTGGTTAGALPAAWKGDAFVAMHGSWNRSKPTGYKVVRVPMKGGVPTGEYEDFLTGFVAEDGQVWGRPVGLAVLQDGSLLVAEDANSVIYRITYTGGR